MAWAEIHWRSAVLDKETVTHVLLPTIGKGPFPTLYLLHGLGGDASYWGRRSRLEWYARKFALAVVMPDGYRGCFTDNREGPAYAQHLAKELPEFMEANLQIRSGPGSRALGGCSMGGFGALLLALLHPGSFVSASSHGGCFELDAAFDEEAPAGGPSLVPSHLRAEMKRVFGGQVAGTRNDVRTLAAEAQSRGQIPALALDCGTEDPYLEANRALHRSFRAQGVPHTYEEYSGGHDWDYYDARLPRALEFHARHLGILN